MTNQQHPLTLPPELVREWIEPSGYKVIPEWLHGLLQTAAQWGADQELEACIDWIANARNSGMGWDIATSLSADLRSTRRPKPQSLAEEALQELVNLKADANSMGMGFDAPAICRALERLQQLEAQQ